MLQESAAQISLALQKNQTYFCLWKVKYSDCKVNWKGELSWMDVFCWKSDLSEKHTKIFFFTVHQ